MFMFMVKWYSANRRTIEEQSTGSARHEQLGESAHETKADWSNILDIVIGLINLSLSGKAMVPALNAGCAMNLNSLFCLQNDMRI